MSTKTVLHCFNPFNSGKDEYNAKRDHIQETVYYAESRFWAILNNLEKAGQDRISWGQKLLHRELVRVFQVG